MVRSAAISAVVAGVGVLVGAGLVLLGEIETRDGMDDARDEAEAEAKQLATELRSEAELAASRAGILAGLATVRASIATDRATVQDLATNELPFSIGDGEVFELFQRPRGGAPTSLLRLPASGSPLDASARPLAATVRGGALRVMALRPVEALYRQGEMEGVVALSRRIDLGSLDRRLRARGLAATLDGGGERLSIGVAGTAPKTSPIVAAVLRGAAGPVDGDMKLEVTPELPWVSLLHVGGFALVGLGLLGLALAIALGRRARRSAPAGDAPDLVTTEPQGIYTATTLELARRNSEPPELPEPPESIDDAAIEIDERPPELASFPSTSQPVLDLAAAAGRSELVAGKYRVLSHIGSGGICEVYLAQAMGEASFERRVALKVLRRTGVPDPSLLVAFLDEARIAAQVDHPAIAQVYDLGLDGGTYFIAMEYVAGADLDVLLAELRNAGELLPFQLAATIGIHIAAGLHAAHVAVDAAGRPLGIIHRDVKPSNVLIGDNGAVKITDFGIAKANTQSRVTEVGVIKGTIDYMSPEHRLGGAVDVHTDIYGVGAILYELVTGRRVSLDVARLLQLDRAGWPHLPPPSTLRPELPAAIDGIVLQALRFDPAERQPSCHVIAEALEALLVETGATASTMALADWLAARPRRAATPARGVGR